MTSCKDDDDKKADEGTVDISKMYLPLKMTSDGYVTSFTYNNKGQVTKIVDTDGYEYSFTYNGNQLISFASIDPSSKTIYTFKQNGNTITINLDGNVNGEKVSDTHILEIDAKGNLLKDDEATYTYDSKGNNTKVSYGEGEEVILTFDDKNGIFKNLNLPKWVSTYLLSYNGNLVNNLLSYDYKDVDFPEDNNSSKITYEYNADGYPSKITSEYKDEAGTDSEVQTIEYTKK
ncbi:hypothetical protein H1R17_03690 [Flavobacterium sp. xlx-214]|uniref:hypothetical protein n=1 Tax=unclassified Flavobacterium TaxID=196869 RepID=UPI0013D32EB1|nr:MULTISPECIES: hypothetical protein [unclassified Flavobacterium]MBA5791993.1 hypothetical protein [Flavobacterium sp. xlx-221]QMI84247.1 hypothetical protein H1R17_03690 [Flavobacterium sp. xlx-214]